MPSPFALPLPRTRFSAAMTLLLALLAAIAVLAVLSGSRAERRPAAPAEREVDPANIVYLLTQQVEMARGLTTLHVLGAGAAEAQRIEQRVADHRQAAQRQLVQFERWLSDAEDRRHHAAVRTALAACWALQDQVLASSRGARSDGQRAAEARRLLTGESQQCHQHLHQALDAWWRYLDQRRQAAADRLNAESQALHLALQLLSLAAMMAALLALRWAPLPSRGRSARAESVQDAGRMGGDQAQRAQLLRDATDGARLRAAATAAATGAATDPATAAAVQCEASRTPDDR